MDDYSPLDPTNYLEDLLECDKNIFVHDTISPQVGIRACIPLSPLLADASLFSPSPSLELLACPQAGELNAYLFANQQKKHYKRFLYIHDSVFLKQAIDEYIGYEGRVQEGGEDGDMSLARRGQDETEREHFVGLWYSDVCVGNDLLRRGTNQR